MKKCIVLILAMIMICTTAFAAGWSQGLGPEKPYTGTPKINFNENIGYMMLHPVPGSAVTPGTDTLRIFMPREDVLTGAGTLYLYTDRVQEPEELPVNAETMIARPMTEVELDALLWGSGTVFEIKLSKPLEANNSFHVQMTEGCIVAQDYDTPSPAFDKNDIWYFNTMTKNIVEEIMYYHVEDQQEKAVPAEAVQVGDTAKLSIVMAEDAVSAAVYCNAGTILPTQYSFTESTETTVSFPAAGEVEWAL